MKPRRNPRPKTSGTQQQQIASKSMAPLKNFSVQAFIANDPFPPHMRRNFKYCENITSLTTGASGVFGTEYRYNLNALYDPDYTSTGHQPYGFDQLSGIYAKYRVDRVSWRVTFMTPGATNDLLCCISLSPGTSASLTGRSVYQPLEWPNTTSGICSSSGTRQCVMTGTIDLHTLCGVDKNKYVAEDAFSATMGTNPSQLALLSLDVASPSSNGSQAVSILVELDFEAYIYQRVVQTLS